MRILEFQRRAGCRGWHGLIRQNCIPNVLYKIHGAHMGEKRTLHYALGLPWQVF